MDKFDLSQFETWGEALRASFGNALGQVLSWVPNLLAMVVVLVVGFVVARLLDRLVAALSQRMGLQAVGERSGLVDSMHRVGINRSLPWIAGRTVFWLTLCVFLTAAFNILGLAALSAAMDSLLAFFPKLLFATVIVIIGLLVATFLRGVVATSADRLGATYAPQTAAGVYYAVVLMTLLAAFDHLGIKFELLQQMLLIAFAALAVGVGLAVGLGGRDVVAGILAGYYTRQRLQAGDRVVVGAIEGSVREVGPVATVIETFEDGMVNRRSVPNVKMLNEAVR